MPRGEICILISLKNDPAKRESHFLFKLIEQHYDETFTIFSTQCRKDNGGKLEHAQGQLRLFHRPRQVPGVFHHGVAVRRRSVAGVFRADGLRRGGFPRRVGREVRVAEPEDGGFAAHGGQAQFGERRDKPGVIGGRQ